MSEWVERYRSPILVLLLVLLASGGVLFFLRRTAEAPTLEIALPTQTPQKELKVYVTGAVAKPGVYTLVEGDRIEEAIKAAGGATAEADLLPLNLASRVKDEMKIHVPKTGEALPGQPQKININTAPAALLDTLPGIGSAISARIVDYRNQNGPFRRIEELRDLKLVPASTFEKIKNLITVD